MDFFINPIKKLIDNHQESVNKRIASGIEKDLLRERYLDERDYIIQDLKDKAQNGNYAEAKEIIVLYADVVTDDMAKVCPAAAENEK